MNLSRLFMLGLLMTASCLFAQLPKVYDEQIDPLQQIDAALLQAQASGRFVICQVGGNWCPWCLRCADYITHDAEISSTIADNFVYIHVNYPRQGASHELTERLHNAGRFGFPVFVVLDEQGSVLHIQDSSFLEDGKNYDAAKVLRFLKGWTPMSVKGPTK